jgi:hypothetical protein
MWNLYNYYMYLYPESLLGRPEKRYTPEIDYPERCTDRHIDIRYAIVKENHTTRSLISVASKGIGETRRFCV